MGYWLLAIGYWLLAVGYWQLAIGDWRLGIGYWLLISKNVISLTTSFENEMLDEVGSSMVSAGGYTASLPSLPPLMLTGRKSSVHKSL